MKRFLIFLTTAFILLTTACTNTVDTYAPSQDNQEFRSQQLEKMNLSEEQAARLDELTYLLIQCSVTYSFEGPNDLSLNSLNKLITECLTYYNADGILRTDDMKGLLTESDLLDGFEDLFGVRKIPFDYEFISFTSPNTSFDNPISMVCQYGAQGIPEMGGIGVNSKTLSMTKKSNVITVEEEIHFSNNDIYFYDTENNTFFFRDEAISKFGTAYDWENFNELPEGISMRCFPSYIRTMEYKFKIQKDGNITILSGKVLS